MNTTLSNIVSKIKQNKSLKIGIIVLCALLIVFIGFTIYLTSSKTENTAPIEIFIYPNENIENVKQKLISQNIISKSNTSFSTFTKALKYDKNIKSGRYVIKPKTSVFTLVRHLRSGLQTPVKLVILNARTAKDFSEKVTQDLMITPEDMMQEIKRQGYKHDNEVFEYIIPNTYEVFWNISAERLLDKLKKEDDKFWENNKEKLKMSGMSKKDIVILASIVSEETNKKDEMQRIAGVYINRLNKNMLLQADPTVKFAVGDFSLKRITGKHLQIASEFNTYKNLGLPPTPICLPNIDALKAVLRYEKHDYIFFCAKEDFSGYHNFAKTAEQHRINAIKYRKALNERGIH